MENGPYVSFEKQLTRVIVDNILFVLKVMPFWHEPSDNSKSFYEIHNLIVVPENWQELESRHWRLCCFCYTAAFLNDGASLLAANVVYCVFLTNQSYFQNEFQIHFFIYNAWSLTQVLIIILQIYRLPDFAYYVTIYQKLGQDFF